LAIRRLGIRGVFIESAKLKSFELEDVTVTLRAAEVTVTDSLRLPEDR